METILLLAHTEADGSLAKSAREALHAARTLNKSLAGSSLVVGLVGENVQAAADSIAACPATKYFGVAGKDFRPVALRRPMQRRRKPFAKRPRPRLSSLRQRRAGRACCPALHNASADAPTPM